MSRLHRNEDCLVSHGSRRPGFDSRIYSEGQPAAARKVAIRIKEASNRLIEFPLSGRLGRVPETRELVIPGTSYIAAYEIRGDEVLIAAALHGRQSWPESLLG